MVSETSAVFNQLSRLIFREDFINFNRCESFSSYSLFLCPVLTKDFDFVDKFVESSQYEISYKIAQMFPSGFTRTD